MQTQAGLQRTAHGAVCDRRDDGDVLFLSRERRRHVAAGLVGIRSAGGVRYQKATTVLTAGLARARPTGFTPGRVNCDIPAHARRSTVAEPARRRRSGWGLVRRAAVFAFLSRGQEASDQRREHKRGCDPTSEHDCN